MFIMSDLSVEQLLQETDHLHPRCTAKVSDCVWGMYEYNMIYLTEEQWCLELLTAMRSS